MWDYLVRILRSEDVPKRPASPEIPHANEGPRPTRTSTEAGSSGGLVPGPTAERPIVPPPVRYCPVCHVRMHSSEWRGVEALLCPECEGVFLFRKSLDELSGAVFSQEPTGQEPIIYTPEGVLRQRRRRPR